MTAGLRLTEKVSSMGSSFVFYFAESGSVFINVKMTYFRH